MGNGLYSVRRKLGVVCLAVPGGMLVLGQTVFKSSLDGVPFLIYWLACFVFTFAAILIALMELRALRRRTRAETRELFEKTLGAVEGEGEGQAAEADDPS
jgi:hypothetical protein